jgi:hypothetical protein
MQMLRNRLHEAGISDFNLTLSFEEQFLEVIITPATAVLTEVLVGQHQLIYEYRDEVVTEIRPQPPVNLMHCVEICTELQELHHEVTDLTGTELRSVTKFNDKIEKNVSLLNVY